MTFPNFLIIGAQKTATTSLYHYLKQHPKIYMSPVKEPKFFLLERWEYKKSKPITDIKAYRALFQGVSDEEAIGEASPQYLYSQTAPERIYHYIPEAKLIAILRNPVERAYSSFLHKIRVGQESLTFDRALREEETRIRNNWEPLWHYKQLGFYYAQLKRYFDVFDRGQIRVYLFEDVKADPIGILQDIFRFLKVDDTFVPDISIRHNVGGIPKNKVLHTLLSNSNLAKSILKPFFFKGLRRCIASRLRNLNTIKPPLKPEIRRQLIQEYQEDILKLQDLIQRDLSKWLE